LRRGEKVTGRDSAAAGGHQHDRVSAGSSIVGRRARATVHHLAAQRLPQPLTSFVGRVSEIAAVGDALATSRLVTLTGPGGIGKTRLALEVAEGLLDAYPDGVWLVELASVGDAALVPRSVAAVLGLEDLAGRPIGEVLATYLARRTALLILDNCEHLIAACAELASALLRASPGLRVLATSRQSLRIDGETDWRVPPLTLPAEPVSESARQLPGTRDAEAVQLFVERARAASPDFMLTDETYPAVAAICARLDGLPLAIELAAARVKELAVEQIAAALDASLHLLTRGLRSAPERHQTLRAMIDWGYQLLASDEQALLRRLSVFAGSCTLEAAEAVGALDDGRAPGTAGRPTIDVLAELVDSSHLVATRQRGGMRYAMLETMREYATEKLREAGEDELTRRRHRDWYLAWAETTGPQSWGPRCVVACDRIEVELDNLRAAMDWSERQGEPGHGLRLGAGLWRFWDLRGHFGEGRARLGRLVERVGSALDGQTGARALFELGYLTFVQGDTDTAAAHWRRGLPMARAVGDAPATVSILALQASHLQVDGDGPAADALLAGAMDEPWLLQDDLAATGLYYMRGYLAVGRGDLALGEQLLERGVDVAREAGDMFYLAHCLSTLGHAALLRDDPSLAEARLREALSLRRELRSGIALAYTIEKLGWVAARAGEGERAACLLGAAAMLRDRAGAPLYPYEIAGHDNAVSQASALLGAAGYDTTFATGAAMRPDEAVAYALGDDRGSATSHVPAVVPAVPVVPKDPNDPPLALAPLTAREMEVVGLITRGLTNWEIADALVISERTVDRHVGNILRKLALRSRTQIVAWAFERARQAPR
jgi:non-specific serine/threonine protein kinase